MNELGKIDVQDIKKAVITAVAVGFLLPIALATQADGFSIMHANWPALFELGANGFVVALFADVIRRLGTDENGKLGGKI